MAPRYSAFVSTPLRFRVPVPAWRGVHCSSASALPSRLPHDQRWRYSSSSSLSSFLLTPRPARRADQELLTPATGGLQPRLTLVNTAAAPRTGTSVREKPCCAPVSSPPHRACSRSYQEGAYLKFRTTQCATSASPSKRTVARVYSWTRQPSSQRNRVFSAFSGILS